MKIFFSILLIITIYPTFQIIIEGRNWMSNLPDDKKLLFINIPASHDTASNEMHSLAESVARTQNATIPEMLRFGVRKLDIRVALRDLADDEDDEDLNLGTCHGAFDCYYIDEFGDQRNYTLKHIILDVKNFLEENPTETVIIWTQSERGDNYENIKRAVELYEKLSGNIFVKYDKDLKLGDVRGKIVSTVYKTNSVDYEGRIIYHSGLDGCTDLEEIHLQFIDKYYPTWEVTGQLKVDEVKEFFRVYDLTFEDAEEEFDNNRNKYPISYSVACTGEHQSILPFPKIQADIVNPFLLQYNFIKGNYYGWIEVDYASENLAKKILETNFYIRKN